MKMMGRSILRGEIRPLTCHAARDITLMDRVGGSPKSALTTSNAATLPRTALLIKHELFGAKKKGFKSTITTIRKRQFTQPHLRPSLRNWSFLLSFKL